MKKIIQILPILLASLFFIPVQGQDPHDRVVGSWLGKLDVGGTSLRLVFNIKVEESGQLSATLDSPDQGARGIGMGKVILTGDSLKIEAPVIMGFYRGAITSDSTQEGTWSQAGRSFPLRMKKQKEAFVLNRPQEPHPPYPYQELMVSFENVEQQFSLGGTLTIPEGEGPFPAVVLVSGSGSQNRDEELFGHKPFKVIADFLTRNGVVVLRYDDRGVGSSGGTSAGSTSAVIATDARAAIEYLFQRGEVDPTKVGVIGHSEGGMIGMMLASEYEDIAFLITLAGPGVEGKKILLDQSEYISRLSGLQEPVIEDNRIVMNRVYDLMGSNETYEGWAGEVERFIGDYYRRKGMDQFSEEDIEQISNRVLSSIPEPAYAWMRYFVLFDPADYLGNIRSPVLALNGEKDCQVLAEENTSAIREGVLASGNKNVSARIIPDLNHLFQPCETGLPTEYGEIEITFDQPTLESMAKWIGEVL
jgi:pimeloyl-ACP methyl ester carboxylesterase